MRRLFHKIYLVFLASLLTVVVIVGLFWRFGQNASPYAHALELAGELAMALLPPADSPPRAQQRAVERLSQRLHADIGLFDANLAPIAAAGRPVPRPEWSDGSGGWQYGQGRPAWSFRLPDRRWIVARGSAQVPNPLSGALVFLFVMAVAIAGFAYPVVRGLTKRIERLQAGVETLGAGNLATRVAIGGRDEVAGLAASFNRAAARIEELVGAHRLLLANASHAHAAVAASPRHRTLRGQAESEDQSRVIAELDDLIEEILLASRLDVAATPATMEHLDLLALVAEECAHYDDCTLEGAPISLSGEPRLLRRLVRNLLENAERHGKPPVLVELRRDGGTAVLCVIDAGCGIPVAQREQVFLPFFQLAGDRKGTGLGLSLVRQIARLHGGEAVATSRPGAPSCFVITIPIR
jgi:signal transduction histidine kinase